MSMCRLRAGLLGVLALLLLGTFSATPAFAEGGPYCHHREVGEKTEGTRITEAEPEEIAGHSVGEQRFKTKILGIPFTIGAKQAQIKGIIYNNADQCQTKVAIVFETFQIVEGGKSLEACEVKINNNNIIKLNGHQAWKWSGEKKQLEEKSQAGQHRDWIFLPSELQQGATGLPNPETGPAFASIRIGPGATGCPLNGTEQFLVRGSTTVAGFAAQKGKENQNLGEWGKAEELVATGGEGAQHFWNGKQFIGVQTKLTFGIEPAKSIGKREVNTIGRQGKTPPQEIAYFES